jgi:hypothetical protein
MQSSQGSAGGTESKATPNEPVVAPSATDTGGGPTHRDPSSYNDLATEHTFHGRDADTNSLDVHVTKEVTVYGESSARAESRSPSSDDSWLLVTEGELPAPAEPPDPYKATWSLIATYEQKGTEAARLAAESGQVGNNADAQYRSWDFAREDYRKVNLAGGDPILRNAEHYLFRKWISAEGVRKIPDGLPFMSPGPLNPTIIVSEYAVRRIHDPIYNPIREYVLQEFLPINKTTPDMYYFEKKGYEAGEEYKRQWVEKHWKRFFEGNPR